jgi:hypothetical protein
MLSSQVICSNKIQTVSGATCYDFGILTSTMHMAWMRQVCGRMKSDYSYSSKLVYNNFPWPETPSEKQLAAVETAAQAVLDARAKYPTSTLADLYDPTTMPPMLARAHTELDRAVDRCYRKETFPNDRARVEHLFALYEKLTAPLAPKAASATKVDQASRRAGFGQEQVHGTKTVESRTHGKEKRPIPSWFREALELVNGGQDEEAIMLFHEEISRCLQSRNFRKCDRILSAISGIAARVPLELLIGVLSATRRHSSHLLERQPLRNAVAARLTSTNRDPERILKGI